MTAPAVATTRPVARTTRLRRGRMSLGRQLVFQLVCLFIAATVLFPIV